MRVWLQSWALLVSCLLFGAAPACAAGRSVQVCVQDQRGMPIVGARVQVQGDPTPAEDEQIGDGSEDRSTIIGEPMVLKQPAPRMMP